jgi:hypothetical protein
MRLERTYGMGTENENLPGSQFRFPTSLRPSRN